MQKDDLVYAGHMLDTARKAASKVIGKTRESFSGSITVDSFLREIESLLKVREMFIEAQHLGRKRMCGCELISALNPLVPLGSFHFRGGVSLVTCSYQRRWCVLAQARVTSPRTIEVKPPRTMAVPM